MFRRIFGPGPQHEEAADRAQASLDAASTAAGETATVRRIVARLERLPVEQARLVASAAYTLARAAQADLEISPEETAVIERELQAHEALDESTAVLVTEMAKLQARTVGGTEDYIVTREFAALANKTQRMDVLRACFAVGAASGSISAEETAVLNQIAKELGLDPEVVSAIRSEFHDRLSAVQAVRRLAEGR
ncbi:MAG TPA: TerB family tellurite resistance protein [Candidatus Limnocylindrales bacterium]|jgi:tellurite resistance protein|nr:TerB family tellurite resistance protein [Candidatus Limnocylindrales bacterium]